MTSIGRAFAQAPNLGAAADYGLLSGSSMQAVSALPLTGKAGATGTIDAAITASNGTFATGSGSVVTALAAAQAARNWCAARPGQMVLPALNGQVLPAGVYTVTGDVALDANQSLTLSGDTGSVYIFNINGSLTVASLAHLMLGEVRPGHVFWHVTGNVTAPGYSAWQGIVLAGGKVRLPKATGVLAVLAADSVCFGPRDPEEDRLRVGAPNVLRIGVPGDPGGDPVVIPQQPPMPPCEDVRICGSLVSNGSFEGGQCVVPYFNYDFGYYQTVAPATTPSAFWSRVGCWMGYASPDWFTPANRFTPQANCVRPNFGAPLNILNSTGPGTTAATRPARTGTSYAGIYSKDAADSGLNDAAGNPVDAREYITQTLNQPLTPGRPCYAEYYASLAPASMYTLKKLQIGFTATPPNANGYGAAAIVPAGSVAVVASNTSLARGLGQPWDHVRGWFTPPTGSSYGTMVLGNFTPGDVDRSAAAGGPAYAAPTAGGYNTGSRKDGAYYYVDDVLLAPFPNAGPLTQNVSCDTPLLLGSCPLPAQAGATYSWSPTTYLDNPLAAQPTLTLPPLPATVPGTLTYTLTVTTPAGSGVAPYVTTTTLTVSRGFGCGPCLHPYGQNPGATYRTIHQSPQPVLDYVLGNPTFSSWPSLSNPVQPPIIKGNGPTGTPVIFDGIYHVVSPIEFQEGTFIIRPGTVFYVDGGLRWGWPRLFSDCYIQVVDNTAQIRIGKNAKVVAEGATFTTTCDQQWGGIELLQNGALETRLDPSSGKRCEISHARVGVMLGTPCRSSDANALLTGTDFLNNAYGVVSLGFPSRRNTDRNGVTGCVFRSDLSQMLPPFVASASSLGYTEAGLVLHGDWHDGIEYANNDFTSLYVGAEVAGGTADMRLHDNSFQDNFGSSIQVAGFSSNANVTTPFRPGRILIDQNYITVPDNASPGGQVLPSNPVFGIEVLPLPLGGQQLDIETNKIYGLNGPGAPRHQTGVRAFHSFDYHHINKQNNITYLDEGVLMMDASGATTQEEYVTNNYFGNCVKAVDLDGKTYAPFLPAISCNTIENSQTGITLETASSVGYLAGPFGGPWGIEPCANAYPGTPVTVNNNSRYGAITYYGLDSPYESVTATGSPVSLLTISGTPCDTRYGSGSYGSYNRPAAGSGTTTKQVQTWEDDLTAATDAPVLQHKWTLQLIDYRERNNQLSQLESFTATLPLLNDAAFDRICLYLLERYRRQGNGSAAQRVRTLLLSQRSGVAEIQQRVAYYDVVGNLLKLAPGQGPASADSTTLATVAGSATGFAPVACATLRYFYPSCGCKGTSVGNSPAQRAAAKPGNHTAAIRLQTYPNPAHEQVTIQFGGATPPAGSRLELRDVASGHLVRSQALAGETAVRLAVAEVAAGVYVSRLVGPSGQVLGTGKVVVIR